MSGSSAAPAREAVGAVNGKCNFVLLPRRGLPCVGWVRACLWVGAVLERVPRALGEPERALVARVGVAPVARSASVARLARAAALPLGGQPRRPVPVVLDPALVRAVRRSSLALEDVGEVSGAGCARGCA